MFINFVQMYPEKSVYFTTLFENGKVNIGYVKRDNTVLIIDTVAVSNEPKISVHASGNVHVKIIDEKIIMKFKIPSIEKLEYPQEICTIFPTNPLKYPLRKNSRKLDMGVDLSWMKTGIFGLKIFLVKPCARERTINEILVPLDSRFPKGTNMKIIYKEYREFGFYISYYQTPKLACFNYDNDEYWIFNIPEDSEKQTKPPIFNERIYEKDGKKIVISEPEIELNKIR